MLLSELVGARVVTTSGDELGRVHDVLLVQDGPVGANGRAGLRLHALAVGRRSFGTKLGYAQGTVQGPWILRALLRKAPRLVPWRSVVERDGERIVVDAERLEEIAGS
jgi:hypothetical protein